MKKKIGFLCQNKVKFNVNTMEMISNLSEQ